MAHFHVKKSLKPLTNQTPTKNICQYFFMAVAITAQSQISTGVFYDAIVIDFQSGKLLKHQEVIVAGILHLIGLGFFLPKDKP